MTDIIEMFSLECFGKDTLIIAFFRGNFSAMEVGGCGVYTTSEGINMVKYNKAKGQNAPLWIFTVKEKVILWSFHFDEMIPFFSLID